jgi:hypothetical protein
MAELPDRRKKTNESLEGLISSAETAVEHIESGLTDIKESIRQGFSEMKRELDDQVNDSKPKIVAWAGWAGVLLLIMAMFGSGYVRDLNRIEGDLNNQINTHNVQALDNAATTARQDTKIEFLMQKAFPGKVIVEGNVTHNE